MIVFLDNPNMIPVIENAHRADGYLIFNLSSLYSGYINITNLLTSINYMTQPGMYNDYINSVEFDIQYSTTIFNTPQLFHSLMQIMYCVYNNINAYVLIQRDPYRDSIMESIIKLIQQRYGYLCWLIEDIDDIEDLNNNAMLSPIGILTLDNDIRIHNDYYTKGLVDRLTAYIETKYDN